VKLLQKTLRKQGARVSVSDLPGDVLEAYEQRYQKNRRITDL